MLHGVESLGYFFTFVLDACGLDWIVTSFAHELSVVMTILGFASIVVGFYMYRAMASFLAFLGVCLASYLFIAPLWGEQAAACSCAVLGVVIGFLAFRWFKLSAALLTVYVAVEMVFRALWTGQWSLAFAVVLIAVVALALVSWRVAPVWAIYFATALWGAFSLVPLMALIVPTGFDAFVPLAVAICTALGCAVQASLFKGQTLFVHAVSPELTYRINRLFNGKGSQI